MLIGRDNELLTLNTCLDKSKHTLIIGKAGYGKRTLLQYTVLLAKDLDYPHTVIADGSTSRNMLTSLAKEIHEAFGLTLPKSFFDALPATTRDKFLKRGRLDWKDINRPMSQRLTVADMGEVIVNSLREAELERKFIIFIENFKCTPTVAKFYQKLFQCSCVVACIETNDQYRAHIQPLVHNFMEKLELKPVTIESSRQIAENWLSTNELRFTSSQARKSFVQHVARDSGGIPSAILGMLENAKTLPEINQKVVRKLSHESAVQYFDMTYVLFGVFVALSALRYISRGISDTELMVLSGVGSAIMIGFFYVMRFLKSPEKR